MYCRIPVVPVPKARPRAGRHGFYTPQVTKAAEQEIAWHIKKCLSEPLGCAVSVDMVFHVPMPRSWSKKRTEAFIGEPHTQRPDIDNFVKLVADACNEILWKDDSQIWKLTAEKRWARQGAIELNVNDL